MPNNKSSKMFGMPYDSGKIKPAEAGLTIGGRMECELSKLQVQSGDVLVLTVPHKLTREAIDHVNEAMAKAIPALPGRVLVLEKGMELQVLRISEEGRLSLQAATSSRASIPNAVPDSAGWIRRIWRAMAGGIRQAR